jgi:hypothetical protein
MIDVITMPAITGSLCFRLGRPHDISRGGKAANDIRAVPKNEVGLATQHMYAPATSLSASEFAQH